MDTPVVKIEVASDAVVEVMEPATVSSDLQQEMELLRVDRDELKDLVQRSRAEFDNYRRRVEREKAEMVDHGAADAVRQVLAVVDDFDRAVKVETQDKEYARGIEMIHQRFSETLKKLGLTPIEADGQTFDPNVHYAVEMSPTDEAADQTILAEYQKGFYFKGKLLRPAMVKVAVKK